MNGIFLFAIISSLGMLIQSLVGFAGSLFAIPLFILFLEPREAIPAYNLVMLFTNLLLIIEARPHTQWKKLNRLLLGASFGVPLGAYGLAHFPTAGLRIIINAITIIFGLTLLCKVEIKLRESDLLNLYVGFLSGLLGGSTSESGPPVVILGLARDWEKEPFRATLLTYFFFLTLMANLFFLCFRSLLEKKSGVIWDSFDTNLPDCDPGYIP